MRHIFKLQEGLSLFLKDGCAEIDSRPVERVNRPIALKRENALFTGILLALVNGHKQSCIDELMPWRQLD